MSYNINSGYGQLVQSTPMTPQGQVFVVADSSVGNRDIIAERFSPHDGKARLFETIDAAVAECTANSGDVIYVAPGHAEDISAATSCVLDVAGISVIGLGEGEERPTLTWTNIAGTLEMDAANIKIKNLKFLASVSAVVVGINVDANGCIIEDCEFDWDETGDDMKTMIDVDGVDHIIIRNNKFIAEDTAGCEEAIRLDDANHVYIQDNYFYGDFTDGVIVGEGAAGADLLIHKNVLYNSDVDAASHTIDLNVAFTGVMSNNHIGTLHAANPEDTVDPGSLLSMENYVCNAIDESGALVPTVVST